MYIIIKSIGSQKNPFVHAKAKILEEREFCRMQSATDEDDHECNNVVS